MRHKLPRGALSMLFIVNDITLFGFLFKMAAVLDEVGKSAEKLVDEEKDEIVDEEDETGAVEASKKKKKKKKKKKAGTSFHRLFGVYSFTQV